MADIVLDLVGEVVNVDCQIGESLGLQPLSYVPKQCTSLQLNERFGTAVGERGKAGAEAGCKDQSFPHSLLSV